MSFDEEYIEKYIRGQLSPEEILEAERRYMSEPAFADAVNEMRLLMELAYMSREDNLRTRVQEAQARYLSRPKVKPIPRVYWAAAATVLLLAVVGGIWLFRPSLGERVFADEFKAPHSYAATLGSQSTEAYQKYDAGDYSEAVQMLRMIPQQDSAWDKAQFFIAISQLAMHQVDQAILGLQGYIGAHDLEEPYYHEAKWYLALALADEGRYEESKKLLHEILATPGASHQADAERVLERLE